MFGGHRIVRAGLIACSLVMLLSGTALAGFDDDSAVSAQGYISGYHYISGTSTSCTGDGETRNIECPYDEHWDQLKVYVDIYKGGYYKNGKSTSVFGADYCPLQGTVTATAGGTPGSWEGIGSHYAYFWGIGSDVVRTYTETSASKSLGETGSLLASTVTLLDGDIPDWSLASAYDLDATARFLSRAENSQLHCTVGDVVHKNIRRNDRIPGLMLSPFGDKARIVFFDESAQVRAVVNLDKYYVLVRPPRRSADVRIAVWRITE